MKNNQRKFSEKDLISIVVPVFNIEKYLTKCIESIIAQDYELKELILVDDESQDNSGMLCDQYARQYPWIKVIHKKNGGLSDTRNVGLKNAEGKYITFIDGDDYVNKNYLSCLHELLLRHNADIAVCEYEKIFTEKNVKSLREFLAEKEILLDGLKATETLLYQKLYTMSVWAKLYKRELFENIEFPTGRIHEDVGTIYKVFVRSQKTVYTSNPLYYYVQRENSITQSPFTQKKMDYISMMDEMLVFFQEKYPQLESAARARYFSACFQIGIMIPNGEFEEYRRRLIKEIKHYRREVLWNKNARVKNRLAALASCFSVNLAMRLCRLAMGK